MVLSVALIFNVDNRLSKIHRRSTTFRLEPKWLRNSRILTQIVYTSRLVRRAMLILTRSAQAANSVAVNGKWSVKYFMHDLSKQRGQAIEQY